VDNNIFELFREFFNSTKWGALLVGLLGVVFKIIAKYVKKKFEEFEKIKNEVREIANKIESYDNRAEGRKGFTETITDHEVRISTLEKIVDRRKQDIIVIEDRRTKE
jgi:hypothetical protein